MKTYIILYAAIAGVVQGVAQAYNRVEPPVPGYGFDEMQWSFRPPFGKPIFVNGTVQDVQKTLEDTKTMQLDPHNQTVRTIKPGQERSIAKDTISVEFCGTFPMTNSRQLSSQVTTIVTISGPAVIAPGPRNCAQVSCVQNSAIWWCNDGNTTIMLPQGMQQVGDAADAIIDECCTATHCTKSPDFPISGQAFSDEGWNVLVRGEDCSRNMNTNDLPNAQH